MPEGIPVEDVVNLRNQGLSNNQITQTLQRQGYETTQILDAMNQADISQQVQPAQLQKGDTMAENPMQPAAPAPMAAPAPAAAPPPADYPQEAPMMDEGPTIDMTKVEELVEAVIDEKWTDLSDNINRIITWKEKAEARLVEMETRLKAMKDDFDKLHTSILEKVGDYDKHIGDVGTEVKALEKVFQKVLPGFMENVQELSRVADTMKKQQMLHEGKK